MRPLSIKYSFRLSERPWKVLCQVQKKVTKFVDRYDTIHRPDENGLHKRIVTHTYIWKLSSCSRVHVLKFEITNTIKVLIQPKQNLIQKPQLVRRDGDKEIGTHNYYLLVISFSSPLALRWNWLKN